MLSGETAIGRDPVNVVRTMSRIAERAEQDFDYLGWGHDLGRLPGAGVSGAAAAVRIVAAITAATWRAAMEADVAVIICCTNSGATARLISRWRPTAPLLGVTPSLTTARQLSMAWGIQVALTEEHATTDEIVWFGVMPPTELGLAGPAHIVAVLPGSPHAPQAPP